MAEAASNVTINVAKESVMCCVCLTTMFTPVMFRCGHRVCSECDFFLDKCPICRQIRVVYTLVPDTFMRQITQTHFQMTTPCDLTMPYAEAQAHMYDCMACLKHNVKKQEETIKRMKEYTESCQTINLVINEEDVGEEEEEEEEED